MKWYKHDPSAALAGMIGLTIEERGAYYTLMDLQYARAPHNDVTDELIVKALEVRPQVWRRLKASLMAKGKVHETGGKLTANRVETELKLARNRGVFGEVSEVTSAKINDLTHTEPEPESRVVRRAYARAREGGSNNGNRQPKDDPRSIRGAFDRLSETLGPNWEDEARELSRQVNLRLVSGGSGE